jgi:hypothetical protein
VNPNIRPGDGGLVFFREKEFPDLVPCSDAKDLEKLIKALTDCGEGLVNDVGAVSVRSGPDKVLEVLAHMKSVEKRLAKQHGVVFKILALASLMRV